MEVNLLAFGIAKDIFGAASIVITIQDDATAANLKAVLETKFPKLRLLKSYMIAVNDEYADDDLLISATDEIAIIPPVSGG
jgi:molybdopterin synthase sulfur carrier subunit